MKKAKDVDELISGAPEKIRGKLKKLRKLIKETVPQAKESISYGLAFYEYKGRLVYFGLQKNHIGLYIPPPIIEDHKKELENYGTTKSAIHLPFDQTLPEALIKKLIKARVKHNEESEKSRGAEN
jgi:uncharacterized protein YdhG (YjbR/CyaY superfamily)